MSVIVAGIVCSDIPANMRTIICATIGRVIILMDPPANHPLISPICPIMDFFVLPGEVLRVSRIAIILDVISLIAVLWTAYPDFWPVVVPIFGVLSALMMLSMT